MSVAVGGSADDVGLLKWISKEKMAKAALPNGFNDHQNTVEPMPQQTPSSISIIKLI